MSHAPSTVAGRVPRPRNQGAGLDDGRLSWAGVIFAAEATMKIGARFATNMAITCCRPNGMPFQKDTGASSEDNASKGYGMIGFLL